MKEVGRWSCLMYHDTPATVAGADYFAVPATAFAEQVRGLSQLSLLGRSLEACVQQARERQVAITFDDAREDNYLVAWPILASAGMTATVFVVSDWVGQPAYCSWAQLRELHAAGWSVQSHTRSHPFLSTLNAESVRRELIESRERIEQEVGAPVTTLALPNGDWPAGKHQSAIAEAGYQLVATSRWHANSDEDGRAGVLGRYTVRRSTTITAFMERLIEMPGIWSNEGLRLMALHNLRKLIGAERYARWRRRVVSSEASTIPQTKGSLLSRP